MERVEDQALTIFTDGSMKERPRRGGLAYILVTTNEDGSERIDEFAPDGMPGATSQEMEIRAVLEALKTALGRRSPVDLSRFSRIVIYTDSTTVHNGYTAARGRWQQTKWTGKGGRPIIHAEIWREIVRLARRSPIPIHVEFTRGKGSRFTKLVDRLAKASAKRPFAKPKTVRHSRRKRSPGSVDPGSVPVEGQVLEIQVISSEPLRVQKAMYYKYEVMSGDLEGAVDHAFSSEHLRMSFRYRVRMNDDSDHPQVAEVLEKIGPSERKGA